MERTDSLFRSLRSLPPLLFAALWLSLTALPAWAAESVGLVLTFVGQVDILRGSERLSPTMRAELFSGDTIVTGDGQAQLRFSDGMLLTLYRDTRFAVDDYRYGQDKDDRAQFSLLNGLIHTLTGQMDKRHYRLKTRLATLGVRGTEYSLRLGAELQVSVDQGRVAIGNAAGTLEVGPGGNAVVTSASAPPRPVGTRIDLRGPEHGGGGRPGGPPPMGGGGPGGTAGGRPAPPGTQNFGNQPPPEDPHKPPPGGHPEPRPSQP